MRGHRRLHKLDAPSSRLVTSDAALRAAVTGQPTFWRDPKTGTVWKIERLSS